MTESASSGAVLQFEQLQSAVSPEFWAALGAAKLDEWKLSEEPREIYGFLSPSSHEGIPAALHLNDRSLPPARVGGEDDGGGGGGGGSSRSPPPSSSSSPPWPPAPPSGATAVPGTLLLVNSRERFLALDRKAALAREAERVWRSAVAAAAAAGGEWGGGRSIDGDNDDDDDEPEDDVTPELSRFLLVAHADLKTYKYTYWFAFPALKPPRPFLLAADAAAAAAAADATAATAAATAAQARPLSAAVGASAAEAVAAACDEFRRRERSGRGPPLAWAVELLREEEAGGARAKCFPLRRLWSGFFPCSSPSSVLLLAFSDPGADSGHPGWTLRNALYAAATAATAAAAAVLAADPIARFARFQPLRILPPLRCVCVRLRRGVVSAGACLSLDVELASAEVPALTAAAAEAEAAVPPDATGWEPNARGKPGPRSVDLSSALDPTKLAADALALNLRLMRWRAAPSLDPSAVSRAKFVLFGAGTLGCAVARTLLGWGATDITFVDSGTVSYSNPPRQSLYEHADCFGGGGEGGEGGEGGNGGGGGGGKPKAAAAAAALRRIFPGCRARGVRLSIPMPGHPLSGGIIGGDETSSSSNDSDDVSRVSAAVAELDALVRASDVAMLLTDTREARWLPALLCAAHGRLCITAALGFDSYVVMRHGGPPPTVEGEEEKEKEEEKEEEQQRRRKKNKKQKNRRRRLGCFFCHDVVAPTDSTRDRALDQQCTVSRPGCAPLAGAVAAELAAAVLAHPLGVWAPPPRSEAEAEEEEATTERRNGSGSSSSSSSSSSEEEEDLPLGEAAHMVRGRLGAAFAQRAMVSEAFAGCTACSARAVAAYRLRGAAFVLDALRDPRSLEALTGLDELHESAAAMVAAVEEEEEEEGEEEGEEGERKREGGGDGEEEWTKL